MAGPLTHIVFAKRFISVHPEYDERAFVIGTSLPDIRYLAAIPREETHFNATKLDEVLHADGSFHAGFLYHNYVDLERAELVSNYVDYSLFPFPESGATALKVLEDNHFAREVADWPLVASYFDDVTNEELSTGIARSDLRAWNMTVAGFITNGNISGLDEFLRTLHFTDIDITELQKNVQYARDEEILERYALELSKLFLFAVA